MFIVDSLLAAPLRGLLWVADKIRQRADEERADDEQGLRMRLADLNRQLEREQIDEVTFMRQEAALLDRLELLWNRHSASPDPSTSDAAGVPGVPDVPNVPGAPDAPDTADNDRRSSQ